MSDVSLLQGSAEWKQARAGSLGASEIADMRARTSKGWGAERKQLMARLVRERINGRAEPTYENAAMRRGKELEPEARRAYKLETGADIAQVGLCPPSDDSRNPR